MKYSDGGATSAKSRRRGKEGEDLEGKKDEVMVQLSTNEMFPLPCTEEQREGDTMEMGGLPPMPARIVVAEGGDFELGRERWKKILKWRDTHSVDSVLETPQPYYEIIKECYPHYFHKLDRTGQYYCYFSQPGLFDMQAMTDNGVSRGSFF